MALKPADIAFMHAPVLWQKVSDWNPRGDFITAVDLGGDFKSIVSNWLLVKRKSTLLTVVGEANEPRARRAKLVPHYKRARTALEVHEQIARELDPEKGKPDPKLLDKRCSEPLADLERRGLLIPIWKPDDIGADVERCGKKGSPTQVKNIDFVTLVAGEHQSVEPTKEGLTALMHELIEDHTLD